MRVKPCDVATYTIFRLLESPKNTLAHMMTGDELYDSEIYSRITASRLL